MFYFADKFNYQSYLKGKFQMGLIRIIALQLYNILLNNYIYCKKKHMIQRVQTLYFIIATILIVVSCFINPIYKCVESSKSVYFLNNAYSVSFFIFLSLLTLLSFNDLKRQTRLILLISLLLSVIVIYTFFKYFLGHQMSDFSADCNFNIVTFFLIFLAKIFYYISIHHIKKDSALLESINRLR